MKVLGISGSPTENANTDRLVKKILDSTGLETEFVKLSDINVGPCRACMACVNTNECVEDDDWVWLSRKVDEADALVLGSPTYYSSASGFTHAFVERLYCFRHVKLLGQGKLAAVAAVGVASEGGVLEWLGNVLKAGGMELVGSVSAKGTPCCFVCGEGETCAFACWNAYSKEMSGMDLGVEEAYKGYMEIRPDNVPYQHGSVRILKLRQIEEDPEVMKKAEEIGKAIREKLAG